MRNVQVIKELCKKDWAFTSELKYRCVGYLYQLVLDLKQSDFVDPPYLNAQISYLSDLEENVQSPQNLLEADHKVYHYMENNKQDSKVKHPDHFYAK